MPRMGGPEMVEALDAMGVKVPLLFVSGYARTALPGSPDRVYGFVQRPFTMNTLLRALRGLLDA